MQESKNLSTLGAGDLAKILRIKSRSLHARLVRSPASLPKPLVRGRGKRLVWLRSDVERWLLEGGEVVRKPEGEKGDGNS